MRHVYEKTLSICSVISKAVVLELLLKYGLTFLIG
jgi:hypothetical protein